ncbi:MAG TPA: hypothetical protein VIP11_15085 [Gemmatimonadaceae bacterium]
MRCGDASAWRTFDARFRPALEAYAAKSNIPRWEWPSCITELLADEALRLTRDDAVLPRRLDAYLVRAVRNKYLYLKRGSTCRDRNHLAAAVERPGEWVIPSTCSDHARRSSAGPDAPAANSSDALLKLARDVRDGLSDEERVILDWVAESVPRRTIAEWLGMNHDACAKRIWRLCRRLRSEVARRSKTFEGSERREIERFLRRAAGR